MLIVVNVFIERENILVASKLLPLCHISCACNASFFRSLGRWSGWKVGSKSACIGCMLRFSLRVLEIGESEASGRVGFQLPCQMRKVHETVAQN